MNSNLDLLSRIDELTKEIEHLKTILLMTKNGDRPWCGAVFVKLSRGKSKQAYHGDNCPAFTIEGNIKGVDHESRRSS